MVAPGHDSNNVSKGAYGAESAFSVHNAAFFGGPKTLEGAPRARQDFLTVGTTY